MGCFMSVLQSVYSPLETEGLSILVSQKLEVTLLLNDHPSSHGIKKVICVLNYLDFPLHQGVE